MRTNKITRKFVISFFFLLANFLFYAPKAFAATELFVEKKNYCEDHDCSSYQRQAPGTILVIHGMNSSMNSNDSFGAKPSGSYVNFVRYLQTLGEGQQNFKVYSIDYNSDGLRSGGTVRVHPLHAALPSSCSGQGNWSNCWNTQQMWESSDLFKPNTLTIRAVSNALHEQLKKMADQGAITNPVTIVAHSMGGLITRDLLYNAPSSLTGGNDSLTGYEVLRQNGIVINEVVTLGTPHDHGFTGSALQDYRSLSCAIFGKDNYMISQFCMLTTWVDQQQSSNARWRDGTKLEINMIDFPQIHWVAVAGLGMKLPDATPGDGLVAIYSALYKKEGRERFHHKVALKTSSSPDHPNPVPGDSSGGFPTGADAVHSNVNTVGFFPNSQQCASSNLPYPIITCTGFFQYAVPHTSLCFLPGYSDSNSYYRDNPAFAPSKWGCGF